MERIRLIKDWDRGDVVLGSGLILEVDELIAANLAAGGFAEYFSEKVRHFGIQGPYRVAANIEQPAKIRPYGTR